MTHADVINGGFELAGAIVLWLNVARLRREKRIRGVHWLPVVLFFVWGLWNLYFYPAVGAPFSFFAGIGVAIANGVWLAHLVYYRYRKPLRWQLNEEANLALEHLRNLTLLWQEEERSILRAEDEDPEKILPSLY